MFVNQKYALIGIFQVFFFYSEDIVDLQVVFIPGKSIVSMIKILWYYENKVAFVIQL